MAGKRINFNQFVRSNTNEGNEYPTYGPQSYKHLNPTLKTRFGYTGQTYDDGAPLEALTGPNYYQTDEERRLARNERRQEKNQNVYCNALGVCTVLGAAAIGSKMAGLWGGNKKYKKYKSKKMRRSQKSKKTRRHHKK